MTDLLFTVGAFVVIGGLASLFGYKRAKANAAAIAAAAASKAALPPAQVKSPYYENRATR